MVGAIRRQDLVATRREAGEADRILDGIRASVREEDLAERATRNVEDALCRLAPREGRVLWRDGREFPGLAGDRLDDGRMLVSDVGVDELAREVEIATTLVVPHRAALAARDRERGQRALGAPRVEHVRSVKTDNLGIRTGAHDATLSARGRARDEAHPSFRRWRR